MWDKIKLAAGGAPPPGLPPQAASPPQGGAPQAPPPASGPQMPAEFQQHVDPNNQMQATLIQRGHQLQPDESKAFVASIDVPALNVLKHLVPELNFLWDKIIQLKGQGAPGGAPGQSPGAPQPASGAPPMPAPQLPQQLPPRLAAQTMPR